MKTRQLSYKKIELDYIIDIKHKNIKISEIRIKPKYLIINENILKSIPFKVNFLNILSMKYGIKRKNIYFMWQRKEIYINDKKWRIDNYPNEIQLDDEKWFKTWNRDNKLNEIGI